MAGTGSALPIAKGDEALGGSGFDDEERELSESIERAWAGSCPAPSDPAALARRRAFWREVLAGTERAKGAAGQAVVPDPERS
jgi:hypothetical protein